MTKYFYLKALILFVGLSVSVVHAHETFRFSSFDGDLPSLSVSAIAQDSRGFMWFGTQNGLCMYNGVDLTLLASVPFKKNTLSTNLIQTFYMDADDVLWIGTYAGLDRYDIASGTFKNYRLKSDVVVSVFRDSQQRLWVGTLDGLGCMLPGTDSFILYHPDKKDNFIANAVVRSINEDSNGTIYASTYAGLQQYDPSSDSFKPASIVLSGNPADNGVLYGVQQDAKGDWWIAKWGTGLIRVKKDTYEYTVFSLSDNRIYCMNTTLDQNLVLVGTWGGGFHVFDKNSGSDHSYTQASALGSRITNDVVYSMFMDKTGLFWLGTNGGGLNVSEYSNSWITNLYADPEGKNGLYTGKTNLIYEDYDGKVWISVSNKGVSIFDPLSETISPMEYNPRVAGSLPSLSVYTVYRISEQELYVGFDKGLYSYNRTSKKFSSVDWFNAMIVPGRQLSVVEVLKTKDGDIWVGTYEEGVFRYNPKTKGIRHYKYQDLDPYSLSDNLVYFIYEDRRSDIWIGTNRGLNRITAGTGELVKFYYNVNNPSGISSNTIYRCYEDSSGIIYFGTRNGGLCYYDPLFNSFSQITSQDGLPSDTVVGITPSSDNYLWLATQNGLVHFNTETKTFVVYKTKDGLVHQQFNTAYYSSFSGNRYFGTPLGIVYFSERLVKTEIETPSPLSIISVTINNQQIKLPHKKETEFSLKLRPDQAHITIGYTAIDYSPITKNTYSYMLEGFDKRWVYNDTRRYAMYTNLKPGKYRFKVRLGMDDSATQTSETSFLFTIDKPIYLRWYAYLVYIFLCGFGFYWYRRVKQAMVIENRVGELEKTAFSLRSEKELLETLSYQDPLTGIPNRRYFDYVLKKECEASCIKREYVSVLMIDIDNFKLFNDSFGHLEGDKALKRVASEIKKSLFRMTDVVARFGGEEFVVVLPDKSPENALIVAERIHTAISELKIPFLSSTGSFLTVSIGCFSYIPDKNMSIESFILYADEALYSAKESGRNKVSVYIPGSLGV